MHIRLDYEQIVELLTQTPDNLDEAHQRIGILTAAIDQLRHHIFVSCDLRNEAMSRPQGRQRRRKYSLQNTSNSYLPRKHPSRKTKSWSFTFQKSADDSKFQVDFRESHSQDSQSSEVRQESAEPSHSPSLETSVSDESQRSSSAHLGVDSIPSRPLMLSSHHERYESSEAGGDVDLTQCLTDITEANLSSQSGSPTNSMREKTTRNQPEELVEICDEETPSSTLPKRKLRNKLLSFPRRSKSKNGQIPKDMVRFRLYYKQLEEILKEIKKRGERSVLHKRSNLECLEKICNFILPLLSTYPTVNVTVKRVEKYLGITLTREFKGKIQRLDRKVKEEIQNVIIKEREMQLQRFLRLKGMMDSNVELTKEEKKQIKNDGRYFFQLIKGRQTANSPCIREAIKKFKKDNKETLQLLEKFIRRKLSVEF